MPTNRMTEDDTDLIEFLSQDGFDKLKTDLALAKSEIYQLGLKLENALAAKHKLECDVAGFKSVIKYLQKDIAYYRAQGVNR